MAAYVSFQKIFENPRQDKTPKSVLDTLISSSSPWTPITKVNNNNNNETPPLTEIFGELHFHSSYDDYEKTSAENSSLQLCTEGLGSESYYDLEDGKVNVDFNGNKQDQDDTEVKGKEDKRSREKERREYPPAMTRMSFKAYKEEGRFVLEEVRIPRIEFLQASREDGRLRLKLVMSEDEDEDEDEEEK